jgi:hypothetical protein
LRGGPPEGVGQPGGTGFEGCPPRKSVQSEDTNLQEWYLLGLLKIARARSAPMEVHCLEDHAKRNVPTVRKSKDGQGARRCRPLQMFGTTTF